MDQNISIHIKEVKILISVYNLKKATEKIFELIEREARNDFDIIILSMRLYRAESYFRTGRKNLEEIEMIENNVVNGLLQLLEELEQQPIYLNE